MKQDARELLFVAQDGLVEPLFASQRELVQAIIAVETSPYRRRPGSLASFLSQIFTGRRPCPPDLAEDVIRACVQATSARGAAPEPAKATLDRLRTALTGVAPVVREIDRLLDRQSKASEVVIVNAQTLEIRGHERATDFENAMSAALIEDGDRYTFVLDEERLELHVAHWQQILATLGRHLPEQDIGQKVAALEADGRLRILGAPSHVCVVPVVALDPRNQCQLFVWDWWRHDDGTYRDSIAQLGEVVTRKWVQDFYLRFVPTLKRLSFDIVSKYKIWT